MGKRRDLTGQRFGRLVVIEENGKAKNGNIRWRCKCDCGNEITTEGTKLTRGNTKSCGCLQKEVARNMNFTDLTGKVFGRLTVIKEYGKDKHGGIKWICKCECGNECVQTTGSLTSGGTRSCGCLNLEQSGERMKEYWQDEEFRKMHQEMIKNLNENEQFKQDISNKMKERWEDEQFRQEMSNRMKERWEDEEYRETHSGENSHRYNQELTDEDRENRRNIEGYNEWCYKVKEKANFTCDCCGKRDGGHLNSHHLDGYHWNKEGRTSVENGICLCESCHKEFHHIYGTRNNTKEQYIEFKENKLTKQEQ